MSETSRRVLGDSPGRVFVKLVIASLLVGLLMNFFGFRPLDILRALERTVMAVWNMGFATIERFGETILLGAVVVIPLFIVMRLMASRR